MGTNYSPNIVTTGLSYCFDAIDMNSVPLTATASGTHNITDISGTHPSGSTTTTAQLSGSGASSEGRYWLNFSADTMNIGDNPTFQAADSGKMYQTIEMWYRPISTKGSCCDRIFGRYHFQFFQISGTLYFMHGVVVDETGVYQHPTTSVTAGQWHHVVGTREDDNGTDKFRWYINNGRVLNQAYNSGANLWNYVNQDYGMAASGHPSVDIAVARMYNRPFSANEVNQNFEAQRDRFGV